jgi:hypothetical protein
VGRFGVLPPSLSAVLDNRKCGNREAGSGQIVASTDCFVRRGVSLSRQGFLQCVVDVLGNPAVRNVAELVQAVRTNLTPDVFVSLNDGHLCRSYMQAADPDDVFADAARLQRFKRWLEHAGAYVERFRLQRTAAIVARLPPRPGAPESPDVRRECLVFSAMERFLDELQDDAIVKTHHMLQDLVCHLLPWLNPRRANLLVFERNRSAASEDADADELRVYAACPRSWRLADPVVMIVRQGAVYEPVCRVTLRDRRGIVQTNSFHFDADRRVHAVVSHYLKRCAASDKDGGDAVGPLLAAMKRAGHPAVTQVVDYAFRLVGFVTARNLYVPLSAVGTPVLVGDAGARMGCVYISDVVGLRPDVAGPAAAEALLGRIADLAGSPGLRAARRLTAAPRGRVAALETADGHVVPLDLRRDDAAASGYLEHLNMFSGVTRPDERVRFSDARLSREKVVWAERTRVVRALRSDPAASRELLALRSPFHPLSHSERRELALALVRRHGGGGDEDAAVFNTVVDALLYGPRPFSLQQAVPVDMAGAILLHDIDVMSGELDRLLSKRRSAFERGVPQTQGWYEQPAHPVANPAAPTAHTAAPSLWRSAGVIASKPRSAKTGSRHRKKNVMPNVDVLALLHLAHRMLHTDAPVPFRSLVDVLRDRIVADARADPAALRAALRGHPTLDPSWTPTRLADAVGRPGYRAGLYDVEVLAPFCDINVVVTFAEADDSGGHEHARTTSTRVVNGAGTVAPHILLRIWVATGVVDVLLNEQGRGGGGSRLFFSSAAHLASGIPSF